MNPEEAKSTQSMAAGNLSSEDIIEDDENIMHPNAYVEKDPKPILQKINEYSIAKVIKSNYKKNAHRVKLNVPIGDNSKMVGFWIIFEKGRRKSTKGLYKLSFKLEPDENNQASCSILD
jgi:hypothetical protein